MKKQENSETDLPKELKPEDYQLTPSEELKLTETFRLFDKDNNEYIDDEELGNILESELGLLIL